MCSDMLAMVRDELSVMVGDGAGGRGGVPPKIGVGFVGKWLLAQRRLKRVAAVFEEVLYLWKVQLAIVSGRSQRGKEGGSDQSLRSKPEPESEAGERTNG
jgi:hypothetical protein